MAVNKPDYLWPNWVEWAKKRPSTDFIAQGTLINKHSIGQTLGNAELHGPVVATGVRRIFNFALLKENYIEHGGRYVRSEHQDRRATLNVIETGIKSDFVNGILFTVQASEVAAIAEREFGYDLLPVEFSGPTVNGEANLFIARKNSEFVGHRVMDNIMPNESSLTTCLEGAATYGPEFVRMWIGSCLIADRTALAEHSYCRDIIAKVVGGEFLPN